MEDVIQFDNVFFDAEDYTYAGRVIDTVLTNRRALGGKLFFDRLLDMLNVEQVRQLYPPRSNADLRHLHGKILSSDRPEHHKQSLFFYILLDCGNLPDGAENFAQASHLPEKYVTWMRGLWLLDHMQFQAALEHLTQPSLVPTFPEEILITLARHAPGRDPTLALGYYHTVSPPLTSLKSLEALFFSLCQVSTTEAFYFSRRQSESVQRHLLESLVSFVLSYARGEDRAARSLELVNLPLTDQEETWLEDFVGRGKGKALPGAKDTILMRRIGTGRYDETLADGKGPTGRKVNRFNWESGMAGLKEGFTTRDIKKYRIP